jgi:hypothetical protein
MATTDINSPTELKPYIETDRMEVLRVLIIGLLVGLIVPLLGIAIANGLISPIFCNANQSFSICASGGVVAYHTAGIVVALAVVALFANWSVFRPLPLVMAATIAMWGFKKFVEPLTTNWIEYYALSMLLTGLCYLLFFWLLRLRNFPLSIILTTAATALVCWALVA